MNIMPFNKNFPLCIDCDNSRFEYDILVCKKYTKFDQSHKAFLSQECNTVRNQENLCGESGKGFMQIDFQREMWKDYALIFISIIFIIIGYVFVGVIGVGLINLVVYMQSIYFK